ncbi:MAG: hypothetical protein WBM44_17785, partial [Waterburya sp.]
MNFNSEINIIQLSALPRLLMIVAAHENLVNIFLPSLTGKSSQKITAILGNILLLSGLIPYGTKSATAQTTL